MNTRRYLYPSVPVPVRLPYSEVCMHMRVAGMFALVELQGSNAVIYEPTDPPTYHSTVTPGEAGAYWDEQTRMYYVYTDDGCGHE